MTLLFLGLLTFTGAHLYPALFTATAGALKSGKGANALKVIVALPALAGLTMIVLGWRSSVVQWVYVPPPELRPLALLLIVLGIYLFVVSNRPSRIKTWLRHPQLTGLVLWASGHLLANGESRSLLLFSWLALWAVLEILLINRRDGAWDKPAAPPAATDAVTLVVALIVVAVLTWAHPWLAGVVLLPGS